MSMLKLQSQKWPVQSSSVNVLWTDETMFGHNAEHGIWWKPSATYESSLPTVYISILEPHAEVGINKVQILCGISTNTLLLYLDRIFKYLYLILLLFHDRLVTLGLMHMRLIFSYSAFEEAKIFLSYVALHGRSFLVGKIKPAHKCLKTCILSERH